MENSVDFLGLCSELVMILSVGISSAVIVYLLVVVFAKMKNRKLFKMIKKNGDDIVECKRQVLGDMNSPHDSGEFDRITGDF